jgi:hypothetical protein
MTLVVRVEGNALVECLGECGPFDGPLPSEGNGVNARLSVSLL